MNWINWVHLGIGIILGIICQRIIARSQGVTSSSSGLSPNQESTLQEQIQQTQLAYQMAKEMSQFKSGFLARTTHVLRSPLNGLIGLHQLILSDLCDSPEEEREFISQAHERALKLLKLIDEILIVARTEHGTNELNIQSLPLTQLLENVHKVIYMLAENRNYPFQVILPDTDIYVLADSHWLQQVLINLIDTSILNMEEGSIHISVQADSDSNMVNIWLDVPKNAIPTSEAIDLINSTSLNTLNQDQEIKISPGMRLLISHTILSVMAGKLEIIPYPLAGQAAEFTRLQISIPQGSPEAEFL
ncbi:sensor histidine kinase [Calothrix rhizosoleniae]|uniref:ATP-binding protein n=1 Tax=Calothrix rhizosoleniae TaxID=888997 RepID=UPI000B49E91E|nr:HAMP domain-containing sensor histidine kinase [Calothrix rhizosoleniae]